jgi:hypothetical protein
MLFSSRQVHPAANIIYGNRVSRSPYVCGRFDRALFRYRISSSMTDGDKYSGKSAQFFNAFIRTIRSAMFCQLKIVSNAANFLK